MVNNNHAQNQISQIQSDFQSLPKLCENLDEAQ